MGVGESHAMSREAVDVWGLEPGILTIARRLPIAEIIEQYEDYVRF
jgi:hypothetical protein